MNKKIFFAGLLVLFLSACGSENNTPVAAATEPAPEPAAEPSPDEAFTVLVGGTDIGQVEVSHDGNTARVDYEYRNNGRGPTLRESVRFDEAGLPVSWAIEGHTTFGNEVDETFTLGEGEVSWKDATGSVTTAAGEPMLYVAQDASPYALWIYARALLADDDHEMPVLPGGTLRLEKIEDLTVSGPDGELPVSSYALSGISKNPTYFLLDGEANFFAVMSPRFAVVREGYEAEDGHIRKLAEEYAARRFEMIQQEVAHNFEAPFRVTGVYVFDPATQARSGPHAVQVRGNRISAILEADAPVDEGEVVIDGAGGTLVAGMYEMHGHTGQEQALLNIAAGVTSLRDMGNNNEVLSSMIEKFETGRLAGPRITRSGFIEGKSPHSSNNGELVSSQEEAVAAVERYATGEFYQIKIYNSMDPDWVPAMVEEARAHGLKVAGHVPAFSNADAMIEAGYDELTHINQIARGWVLEEGEDTRSLLRLTALRRLPGLDLDSPAVMKTIDAMAEKGVAVDPTLAIHEMLLRSRNGTLAPGVVDFIDNMPVSDQRGARKAWADIATPEDDEAYWQAYDQLIAILGIMRDKGIFMVPGTDLGGSFFYHRELELYQEVGMTAPEILAWASYGMADYLGQSDELGSIEEGKLADVFLVPGDPTADLKAIKTISMVVKDGTVYFPSEIYPHFGIEPFVDAPGISGLKPAAGAKLGHFTPGRDLFLPQYDSKTDVDDLHSMAGAATMLRSEALAGVDFHAVAGAYGIQDGLYVPAPELFEAAFGESASDAHGQREAALETVTGLVQATLQNGGKVWVAEAGQSDFTADWLARVYDLDLQLDVQANVHVVQHSDWNESVTDPEKLAYVKTHASYHKIADGNAEGNGTPGFNSAAGQLWESVLAAGETGEIWRLARDGANAYNGAGGRYLNESIAAGGMDFSDTAEVCWIFGYEALENADAFFEAFLPGAVGSE